MARTSWDDLQRQELAELLGQLGLPKSVEEFTAAVGGGGGGGADATAVHFRGGYDPNQAYQVGDLVLMPDDINVDASGILTIVKRALAPGHQPGYGDTQSLAVSESTVRALIEQLSGGGAPAGNWELISADVEVSGLGDYSSTVVVALPTDSARRNLFVYFVALAVTDVATSVSLTYNGQLSRDENDNLVIKAKIAQPPIPGTYPLVTYSTDITSTIQGADVDTSHTVTFPDFEVAAIESAQTWSPAEVAAQPDAPGYGRAISALTPWNGKLYASYGSMDENTGPIHVLALDPTEPELGFVSEAVLTTEQLGPYKVIGDKLYAPFLDPQGGIGNPENGMYAWRSAADPTWHTVPNTTPYMEHIFDIAEVAGKLFICGLAETVDGDTTDYPTVLVSEDDGATWAVSYQSTNSSTGSGNAGWIYTFFQFDDRLYIYDPSDATWVSWNGVSWSAGDITGGLAAQLNPSALAFPPKVTVTNDDVAAIHHTVDMYCVGGTWVADPAVNYADGQTLQGRFGVRMNQEVLGGNFITGHMFNGDDGKIYGFSGNRLFSFHQVNPSSTGQIFGDLPSSHPPYYDNVYPVCGAVMDGVLYWGGYDGTISSAPAPVEIF